MQKKKTLSIVIFLGLLVAIPLLTTMLAQGGFEIRISALEEDDPRNVVISDVGAESFKVSWVTEREVVGGILMADGNKLFETDSSSFHTVDVTNLQPSTTYSFKLMSGAKEFSQEDGTDYSQTTSSIVTTDETFLVYGQVFSADGYSFQQGGVITLKLANATLVSQAVSGVINEAGGYKLDLAGLLSESMNRTYPYKTKSDAILTVYTSHAEGSFEKKYTVDFSKNRQIQNIYLGEVNIELLPAIEGE